MKLQIDEDTCGEGLSAEGRIILSILLILSKLFSYKKNPFLLVQLIKFFIRSNWTLAVGGWADT